ncbi:tripartite tricarboxylate transporter TctB family protein [Lysinibacillus sp. NPDC097287]|uniref:tripartite tricarboxylate transporter TctB family protein n=1 Tax=Lysinibacillus sp. NPDC097287 TaxID=3364144 RepID=UPI0037F71586
MSQTFDKVMSIVLFIVGILFIVQATQISDSAYGSAVGPKTFPLGLGIVLVLLSLRLFYETWRQAVKARLAKGPEDPSKTSSIEAKKFLIIFASAIAYVFFLEIVGYVITTFIFLLIGFQTMERGKLLFSVIISAAFSIGIYYLFSVVLGGSLPSFPTF